MMTAKRNAAQELFLPVFSSLLDALLLRAQVCMFNLYLLLMVKCWYSLMYMMATTNMQAKLRCKRESKSSSPLDGDPTVDANLALKSSHHLAEFFNHPLTLALICIYGWIPIQRPKSLACMLAPKPCLHISCCHIWLLIFHRCTFLFNLFCQKIAHQTYFVTISLSSS
jgi:hypothetical protein